MKDICAFFSGGTPTSTNREYYEGKIPFIGSGNIFDETVDKYISIDALNNSSAKLVQKGDVLYALYGANSGDVAISKIEGAINQAILCIRTKENEKFLFQVLSFKKEKIVGKYLQGGQGNLSAQIIKKLKLRFPKIEEQNKIANFLIKIDNRIETQNKITQHLESLITGYRQKIFSQEIRFKNEKGNEFSEWEVIKLSEITERIKKKNSINNQNVLTISAKLGLVSQLEYFNKSVSAKTLTGYYLLDKNDFAYNKSYSKGYPMGAIKRLNRYDSGVVSTLYICFKLKETISLDFMEHYFNSGTQNKELEKVAQEGARNHGLLNIGINDFFGISLKIPSFEEQTKIANFLSSLDKKLKKEQEVLEQYEQQKTYLLQNLFI